MKQTANTYYTFLIYFYLFFIRLSRFKFLGRISEYNFVRFPFVTGNQFRWSYKVDRPALNLASICPLHNGLLFGLYSLGPGIEAATSKRKKKLILEPRIERKDKLLDHVLIREKVDNPARKYQARSSFIFPAIVFNIE